MNLLAQSRRFRAEWFALSALLLLLGVVLSFVFQRERNEIEAQERDRLQVQARVIDENLLRQLEGVDSALLGVRDELEHLGHGPAWATASAKLELLSNAMPGVRTMAILDADGTIVASSRPELIGTNSRQRALFDVPRRHPDPSVLYVSPPFNTVLGSFVVAAGRVLTARNGEFAGVVTATLDPEYFNVVLQSVLYAPDMRTTLIHADGKVFLNMPANAKALGMDLAGTDSLLGRHQRSGQTATLATGRMPALGEDRMVAMRTIERAGLRMDKPPVVAVSRQVSAVYLPWRAKVWRFGAFYAVVVVGAGLGLYVGQGRRRALDRIAADAAKERQQGAERLELALRGADLGLWDLHVPSGTLVVNARERELLGYSPAVPLPENIWRKLIHPDDRPVVGAAFERHLRGETAGFECEHRMQHQDGHWVWISSRAMIVERDAAGAPVRMVGTHLDVTGRKQADADLERMVDRLRSSEERLSLALEGSGLALFDWDIEGDRIYHCAQAAAMRDDVPEETTTSPAEMRLFVHPDDLEAMQASMKNALAGVAPLYHAEFRIRKRSGEWLWLRARGRVVQRNAQGRALRLAGTYADIDERKVAEERLRHRAEFDTLTDLPNRALFIERLQQAMGRATCSSTMALLFLDVDRFKSINDTLGHEAGDQLLKVFATRMRESVRQTDTVARLAGDEFTVILEGLRDSTAAKMLADKLVETLRAPIVLAGKVFEITTSVGVAMWNEGATDGAELLRRADAALYEAKRRGRNGSFCEEVDALAGPFPAPREHSSALRH